jgi:hypothetical protein
VRVRVWSLEEQEKGRVACPAMASRSPTWLQRQRRRVGECGEGEGSGRGQIEDSCDDMWRMLRLLRLPLVPRRTFSEPSHTANE